MFKPTPVKRDAALTVGLAVAIGVVYLIDRIRPAPEVGLDGTGNVNVFRPNSVYAQRTAPDKEKWIVKFGGSTKTEKAVHDGLDWLARHQAKDGSWSSHCLGTGDASQCLKKPPCGNGGGPYEIALTGLALLAFQAGGHYYFNDSTYSEVVRRGLNWLAKQQQADGGIFCGPNLNFFMYQHGIAAFALAESCAVAIDAGQPLDKDYHATATKAISFIQDQQHTDGGWKYYRLKSEQGDTSVAGWQVLALKSAKEAHIYVAPKCVAEVEKFFKGNEIAGELGRTAYQRAYGSFQHTEATTGVGMLVHQFLLGTPDSVLVKHAAPYLAGLAEKSWGGQGGKARPDYYLWYNCTLAMFQAGGEEWKRWNAVVSKALLRLQKPEEAGCARGSWDSSDKWDGVQPDEGGRIYTTALAVLTLEVYYRYASKEQQ